MDNKKIDVVERLARARALHQKSARYMISNEELTKAKKEGRLTEKEFTQSSLNRLWNNEYDAAYDDWRELYKERTL